MQIKNREDLKKYRESAIAGKTASDKNIKFLVGLGTCGTAAGADMVWAKLENKIKSDKISGVELVKVGCVGYCYAEPTVEVVYPDGESVLLGNIKEDNALDVIELHVKKKTNNASNIIKTNIASNIFKNGGKK